MKARLVVPVTAVVSAVAVVTLIAGVATAGISPPPRPTTPYPGVPINKNVCKPQATQVAQAQTLYNLALKQYNRELNLFNRQPPAISRFELNNARKALDNAVIALDKAEYAQATCQNNKANPKDKNCINLALQLNQLLDQLPVTQDLQAIAYDNYVMAWKLFNQHKMSEAEYETYEAAYKLAKLQTQLLQEQIADQKEEVAKAGCKDAVRPTPTPTKSANSPSPSPSTSGRPTPTPTSSPSPSRSTTTSPTS